MLKEIINKIKEKVSKNEPEHKDRFLKFYYKNQKRLNKERKGTYWEKRKNGICVRCNKPAVKGRIFCQYHLELQKNYNKKARDKNVKGNNQ
jgi:hypothetical protein